jgi:ribosomal protein S18 acetylase RimI-like enzyme
MLDAERLKALEACTLGDSDLSAGEMRAVLARPEQRVYLAEADAQAVGFCATFETASPQGRRLELDMLGVAEQWRGRGIAQALVRRAMGDAAGRGIRSFRAVVATDNAASARVFERCGLLPGPERRELLVYTIRGTAPQAYLPGGWQEEADGAAADWPTALRAYGGLPGHQLALIRDATGSPVAGAALLTVYTIAYSGLWVEAHWSLGDHATRALARAAVERAKAAGLDEVGLLLARSANTSELWVYVEEGYQRAGTYRWFTRHEDR